MSQTETKACDPFWDERPLLPGFVTQLLGQTMPERRQDLPVETPYGRVACPRKALVLDRKS